MLDWLSSGQIHGPLEPFIDTELLKELRIDGAHRESIEAGGIPKWVLALGVAGLLLALSAALCPRRLNIDPPCRFKFDPGRAVAF